MNVWLVNPFDPLPSVNPLRYSYLVKLLVETGHTVTWWTSQFAHLGKRYLTKEEVNLENSNLMPNGRIITTWTTSYTKHVGLKRLVNHVIWAFTFYRVAKNAADTPDVMLLSSPPLTVAFFARRLARARRSILVLDIQDLWPEAFDVALPPALRPIGKIGFAPLRAVETANFRQADALIAVSQTYLTNALARAGDKPGRVIPIGIDLDRWPTVTKKYSGQVNICYAGTLGAQHDVATVIRAAKMLESRSDIRFFIAGDGPQRQEIEALARSCGLSNITFTGWLDLVSLQRLLLDCHVGILAVSQGSVISIPAKTFDYMAAGLALVSSVPGELQCFMQANRFGVHYHAASPESLAAAISAMTNDPQALIQMGHRSRQIVESEFDRRKLSLDLINFAERLVVEKRISNK